MATCRSDIHSYVEVHPEIEHETRVEYAGKQHWYFHLSDVAQELISFSRGWGRWSQENPYPVWRFVLKWAALILRYVVFWDVLLLC
jgi:hypothetical protein